VAMLSSYGIAQIAVLLVIELGYMMVIGFKWPYADSTENKFHIFLSLFRIAVTGCSIGYVHSLKATDYTRQILGYIQLALHLAVFIVMFALATWNTILVI
ncbi:MAG: TRP-like family, partial [Podila humilis]